MHAADKNQGEEHLTIQTSYSPPPIPVRQFDWSAVYENYEPGDAIGRGETEPEAIGDLKDQLDIATHPKAFSVISSGVSK
jgi:hypothetical protein